MSVRSAHIAIGCSLVPLAQAVTAAASSPADQHARLTFSVNLRTVIPHRP